MQLSPSPSTLPLRQSSDQPKIVNLLMGAGPGGIGTVITRTWDNKGHLPCALCTTCTARTIIPGYSVCTLKTVESIAPASAARFGVRR